MELSLSNSTLLEHYQTTILEYVFNYIGQKNVKAIIFTGSVARNQANFKEIDGEMFLESDIDVVIVVRARALLKCLSLVKKLSRIITDNLHKSRLLSEVSLSVVTEKSITNAKPSIFMYDLIKNGNLIYQSMKDKLIFPHFLVQDIPKSDIYRLLFNRMVEALNSFVTNCLFNKFDECKNILILHSLEKLDLSIIQSIIMQSGLIIFHLSPSLFDRLENEPVFGRDPRIQDIAKHLRDLQKWNKHGVIPRAEVEKLWIDTVERFRTFLKFYGFDESSQSGFDKMLIPQGLTRKTISSILIFIQYCKISPLNDLIKSIIFIERFGPDRVYLMMYNLFVSSLQFLNLSNKTNIERCFIDSNDAKRDKWLDSFNFGMKVWKHKTGA